MGNASQVTAWLAGSGAYDGYTYYFRARGANALEVDGIIFRGSPPTPVTTSVPVAAATPAATATPATTPTPAATAAPPTDGEGAEHVVGTAAANLLNPYQGRRSATSPRSGTGWWCSTFAMNDPRVTGMATWGFSIDVYGPYGPGGLGPEWGPFRLESDHGSWEGSCSGATGT